VLDARTPEATAGQAPDTRRWPAGVLLRAERTESAGRRGDATWRLFDLAPNSGPSGIEQEPAPGPGEWVRPSVADAADAAACDGRTETAAEVGRPDGIELGVPETAAPLAVEIDYGHGLFNRVPKTLHVRGLEHGQWRDLEEGPSAAWLRARTAHQLLRDQQARLVVRLLPSHASRLRLSSPDGPWDAPELRLRVVADR
jgi:hypothetical protein